MIDPIFGSLNNDTYAILHAFREELNKNNIPCTVYHFGQELGKGECLEIDLPDCDFGPQLMVDNNQLVFCLVRWYYSRKQQIAAVDLCDPDGFIKIVDAIKKWYYCRSLRGSRRNLEASL